ncbi:hypothetical protein B0H19DRAFT_1065244 [Mycena capillaripes]|nr:hypothetical protein B0H19DRAFT_1065244 [Mycena capillaripes]
MPPYRRAIPPVATQRTMSSQKLDVSASQPYIPQTIPINETEPPRFYISLESTIQSIRNGQVGTPRLSPLKSTSPSIFDSAAQEYDAALLRRECEAAVVRGIRPRLLQPPRELTPTSLALLGILSPSPSTLGNDHSLAEATTPLASTFTERPASPERPSQFAQLFPEGLCAADEPPSPSLADAVYQTIVSTQAAEIQPYWEREYSNIRRATLGQPQQSQIWAHSPKDAITPPPQPISESHEGLERQSQFVDPNTTPRCPLGVLLPGKDELSTGPSNMGASPRPSHENALRTVGTQSPPESHPSMSWRERKHLKPSEVCVTAMEDKQRGILGEIMNRQYVRRRESDDQ